MAINYRGIKLLNHTIEVWERAKEMRVRRGTSVFENHFGFMPGCHPSCEKIDGEISKKKEGLMYSVH